MLKSALHGSAPISIDQRRLHCGCGRPARHNLVDSMKTPTPWRRGPRVSRPVGLPAVADRDRHELRGHLGIDPVVLGLEVDHRFVRELKGDRGGEVVAELRRRDRVGDDAARRAAPPAPVPVIRITDRTADVARLREPALDVVGADPSLQAEADRAPRFRRPDAADGERGGG